MHSVSFGKEGLGIIKNKKSKRGILKKALIMEGLLQLFNILPVIQHIISNHTIFFRGYSKHLLLHE